MFGRKTDKQCAQAAVASAIAGQTKSATRQVMEANLTREEMERAQDYLASGKPVTGR